MSQNNHSGNYFQYESPFQSISSNIDENLAHLHSQLCEATTEQMTKVLLRNIHILAVIRCNLIKIATVTN